MTAGLRQIRQGLGTGTVYVEPGGEAFPWAGGGSGGTFANNWVLAGYGSFQDSMAMRGQSGDVLTGNITLASTANIAPNGNLQVNGNINGPGGLYVTGASAAAACT